MKDADFKPHIFFGRYIMYFFASKFSTEYNSNYLAMQRNHVWLKRMADNRACLLQETFVFEGKEAKVYYT